ncbi:MAG: hypothetical protein ABI625_13785, partial [bacterium]
MLTRREALGVLGSASAAKLFAPGRAGLGAWIAALQDAHRRQQDATPRLAPGAPTSPERLALIESFRKDSEGVAEHFEARTFQSDWAMPYRLFQPKTTGRLPLVVYLHGSGGLGTDNA